MATKEQTKISKEVLFDLHRRMVRIRLLEEAGTTSISPNTRFHPSIRW